MNKQNKLVSPFLMKLFYSTLNANSIEMNSFCSTLDSISLPWMPLSPHSAEQQDVPVEFDSDGSGNGDMGCAVTSYKLTPHSHYNWWAQPLDQVNFSLVLITVS